MQKTSEENDVLESRLLCENCIGESFLRNIVNTTGEIGTCFYCQSAGKAISIRDLVDRFETVFEQHFQRTPTQPTPLEDAWNREEGTHWTREGQPVAELIAETAGIDELPADDIAEALRQRHYDPHLAKVDEKGAFDADAQYINKNADDFELQVAWEAFEHAIKTENRFFSRIAIEVLDPIFDGLADHLTHDNQPILRSAGPGTNISELFRARVFQADEKLKAALLRPDNELGPPAPISASAGRMNARGISVFYGASTHPIALAEVRPPVGSRVVVARFRVIRPITLLDVEALRSIYVNGSLFDDAYIDRLKKARFLDRLSRRITIPVMPDDESFDYLVTQAIADYLATKLSPEIHGLIYPSAQGHSEGFNVVLFHKAAQVKALDIPEGADLNAQIYHSTDEGDEPAYSVVESLPSSSSVPVNKHDDNCGHSYFREINQSAYVDSREPTLHVDPESLVVHHVEQVVVQTSPYPVLRHRFGPNKESF